MLRKPRCEDVRDVSPPADRQPRKDALRNRERVLDAAVELVRRDGEKVPMAQVAEHAGVGIGTVYRHFPTREDLLSAVVFRSFSLALDNARAAAAHSGSALEGIRQFFLATVRDRERFVLPAHGGPRVFNPAIRERQADIRTSLGALIERGQATGEPGPRTCHASDRLTCARAPPPAAVRVSPELCGLEPKQRGRPGGRVVSVADSYATRVDEEVNVAEASAPPSGEGLRRARLAEERLAPLR